MRTLITLILCLHLSGCWFVWIPGGLVQKVADGVTGAEGEHCVSRAARVGDKIATPQGSGEVKSLSGTSRLCTDPMRPIRARIE